MEPATIAGLIGTGISTVGGIASSAIQAGAKWGSSTYMRVAKEMARYNQAMSEEMYNKYQSPSALMSQYKEAGLNPYLIYSNAAQGGSPEPGQVSTNPDDYHDDSPSFGARLAEVLGNTVAQYQQIVSAEQARTNAKAQYDLIQSQTARNNAITEGLIFKNQKADEMYNLEKALKSTKLESDQLNLLIDRKYKEKRELVKIDKELAEIDKKKSSTAVDYANRDLLLEKKREVTKNIDMMDTKIESLRHSMDMQDKKYNLAVTQMANANYWRSREFGLKQRAADYRDARANAIDKQFDDKMRLARQNLGLRVMSEMNKQMRYAVDAARQDRKDFYNAVPSPNPARLLGVIK